MGTGTDNEVIYFVMIIITIISIIVIKMLARNNTLFDGGIKLFDVAVLILVFVVYDSFCLSHRHHHP